jgi:hypothetical protein
MIGSSSNPESIVIKKIAIGCGVVALLFAIATGIGLYWAYSKAKDYAGSFAQLTAVGDMDQQVSNKSAFAPPETGELTAEQVAQFAKVNEQVQAALGPRFQQLKTRYDELEARMKAESRPAGPAEALTAIKDLAGIVKDVRTAQVAALNAQGLSVEEYRWIRDQAYAAAGMPTALLDIDGFVEAAKGGDVEKLTKGMQRRVSDTLEPNEKNKALVQPISSKLGEWAPLAWLGF